MVNLSCSELLVSSISDNCLPITFQESTLQSLFVYDFLVDCNQSGEVVAQRLEAEPKLPGVILTDKGQLFGMISRQRFLEYLSRPFGRELFLKRSLKTLYQFAGTDILVLPVDTKIVDGTSQALQRSVDLVYEPIVVEIEPYVYRILDVHHLLIAQCRIHQMATKLLHEVCQKMEISNQELERQASLDGLTQVANRRRFDEYLAQQWFQMAQHQHPLSLIIADIDCFKGYNDTYGHQAGDKCIKLVALAMKQAVNLVTGTNCENLVARYGGEEFAVILPGINATDTVFIAEKIRSQVKALNIIHIASQVDNYLTLSLGVATIIPQIDFSLELLIAEADRALYEAKGKGRDRVILSQWEVHIGET
ncbi:MAG: diguanylate cyclase [Microcoleaceae cyanobacterium]